jgi:protein-S-isoprenylcysteine O-methyltransferase Ste14
MHFPKAYADLVAKLRVPSGFILIAGFLWLAKPTWASFLFGMVISLHGLGLRAWAAGHLEKNIRLADGGPYAFVRNPLYIGTLTAAAGFVIASRRWELAVLFALVFFGVYLPVVELEEQHLRTLFPAYAAYAERVPKFIPKTDLPASDRKWKKSVYLRNEEYKAAFGLGFGAVVLIAKCLLK